MRLKKPKPNHPIITTVGFNGEADTHCQVFFDDDGKPFVVPVKVKQ